MPHETVEELSLNGGSIDFEPPAVLFDALHLSRDQSSVYLVGANGSGKSTLALLLAGVIPEIMWAKVSVQATLASTARSYQLPFPPGLVQVLPQRWEHTNLGFGLRKELNIRVPDSGWKDTVFERLRLPQLFDRPASVLSDGERKRVMTGLALARIPALLVTDEWQQHLDNRWRSAVADLLLQYEKSFQGFHIGLISSPAQSGNRVDVFELHRARCTDTQSQSSPSSCSRDELEGLFSEVLRNQESRSALIISVSVSIVLPRRARDEVMIPLKSGSILQIVGPNGSGKTTILKGLWDLWRKRRIKANGIAKIKLALVLADPYYQVLGPSARNELERAIRGAGVTSSENLPSALCKMMGLLPEQDVLNLSFGQRKLLAVAASVLRASNVLAVDEPFAGLDQNNRAAMTVLLCQAAASGAAVVITSHRREIEQSANMIELKCPDA